MMSSYRYEESPSDVTAILISYNTETLLPKSINDLKKSASKLSLQTIIIDNASKDNSVDLIHREFSDCKLIENKTNVGFGRANNQALPFVKGRYLLLLNTDAFVSEDTLVKTVGYMDDHPECGLLGVKLVGRDGQLQPSCRYFPTPLNMFLQRTGFKKFFPGIRMMDDMSWDHESPRECDWVPGCYLLIRKEVVDQVGLFDERYFLYSEEVDLCFSAKKSGWKVHYYADTTVVHLGGESAKSDGEVTKSGNQLESLQIESELLYFRKNHGVAAVLGNVFLQLLSSAILAVKSLLKGKCPKDFWKIPKQVCLLFWKTRLGAHPIR